MREEATGPYRHISSGAWPFSTRDHGWPISDCTSEGVKAALGLAALGEAAGKHYKRNVTFWFYSFILHFSTEAA